MNDQDDLVREFLVESQENLDQLDRDLVSLEKAPRDRERLARIFRAIHTVKGTCGFFGFAKLEELTHAGEGLLSRLRDGYLILNPDITSGLLALVDAVRGMLAAIERTGQEGDRDHGLLIATLTRLKGGTGVPMTPPARSPAAPKLEPPAAVPVPEATEAPELPLSPEEAQPSSVSDSNIRVDVGLLDKLMTVVGELVLARNQIVQLAGNQKDPTFASACQRLDLITTELQEGVMKTRMQPICNVWNKFPRVARDLALACGKQVRLDMEGKETELDKTLIEAVKDPLTHLIRNAIDHGIETPEARLGAGKPAEGRLLLRAFHEGGQVNIEMIDDGAGIDLERVKHKALTRGLLTPAQAARLSDRELLQLIFLPGFSTADKVTNVSGRGVGMDVVKTNIEKIGGTVDLQSQPGQGTTVKVKIPLTLAIIPALIVTSGGDRYAIPQVSLLELVRLEGAQARRGVERIHGCPVYRRRGNLLPLVYLGDELGIGRDGSASAGDSVNIVILQAGDRQMGLVVEGIHDTEEIVVKPLGKQLKGIPLFAGATIMGDGKVALILDVLGLAQRAGVVSEVRDRRLTEIPVAPVTAAEAHQTLVLVGLGEGRRLALPLSQVARLEAIPRSAVERTAGRDVVQYRGRILPLLRLADVLPGGGRGNAEWPDPLQVLVHSEQGRTLGLVVDRILDIVDTIVDMQPVAKRPGVAGSAVIQQRVTDLVDLKHVVAHAPV